MTISASLSPHRLNTPQSLLDMVEVERRITRACKTIRALPDRERKFQVIHSLWPECIQSVEEAYGYNDAVMPRFRPTPFDVGDVLVALSWARGLEPREWRLIWWRSLNLSFRQIGFRLGRSDETARRYYKDAMIRVWGQANTPYVEKSA